MCIPGSMSAGTWTYKQVTVWRQLVYEWSMKSNDRTWYHKVNWIQGHLNKEFLGKARACKVSMKPRSVCTQTNAIARRFQRQVNYIRTYYNTKWLCMYRRIYVAGCRDTTHMRCYIAICWHRWHVQTAGHRCHCRLSLWWGGVALEMALDSVADGFSAVGCRHPHQGPWKRPVGEAWYAFRCTRIDQLTVIC